MDGAYLNSIQLAYTKYRPWNPVMKLRSITYMDTGTEGLNPSTFCNKESDKLNNI